MSPKHNSDKRSGVRCRWLRFAERILAITGLCFLIYHCCFSLDVVTTPSMSPTIRGESYETGDWVLTERVSGWFFSPRRWNLVRFRDSEGLPVIKRVVGFPGEDIQIDKGRLLISGVEVPRPAPLQRLQYIAFGNLRTGKPYSVTNGYYVLGDNTRDSQDSRFEGTISDSQLMGRPWLIVWPASRVGFLNP